MFAPLLLTGCFDPPPPSSETESGSDTDTGGETDADCAAGQTQDCACEGGGMGTQVCEADGSFGTCECEGTSLDSGSSTGPAAECTVNADCSMAMGECLSDVCDDGTCAVQALVAGTPCGDATDNACNGADACDGRGVCLDNVIAEGSVCEGCEGELCVCGAGECAQCETFAPVNSFDTGRAIQGWELSGDWALRDRAPQSFGALEVEFDSFVLGTDGNRTPSYPGAHTETSFARTRLTVIPSTLSLSSWHVDEGGSTQVGPPPPENVFGGGGGNLPPFDNKRIRVSIDDGATWITAVDCGVQPLPLPAFCELRAPPRAAGDWDLIELDMPPMVVGQPGIVEFGYDTADDCCGAEQGWFIDDLNFATECACAGDQNCEEFSSDCGSAVCSGLGMCNLIPEAAGVACGDATSNSCNAADTCNGNGQCDTGEEPVLVGSCNDCPGGTCSTCFDGQCNDCSPAVNDFFGAQSINGWIVENLDPMGPGDASWGLYTLVPRNQNFDPNNVVPSMLSTAPALGVNGNRSLPYPGGAPEFSRIVSPPGILPMNLTFDSWNVDEGGSNGSMFDVKLIEVSVAPGMWNVLVDCSVEDANMTQFPFCIAVNQRALDDWDPISISMGMLAGAMGQIRFTYNTGDGCCDFERGWYIDNLNFAQYCE